MQDSVEDDSIPCTGISCLADDYSGISEKKLKALRRVHQAIACCAEVLQNVIRDEDMLQAGTKTKLQQKSDHLKRAAACLEEYLQSDGIPAEVAPRAKRDDDSAVTCHETAIVSSQSAESVVVPAHSGVTSAVAGRSDHVTVHDDVIKPCDKLGQDVPARNNNDDDLPGAHFFSPGAPDHSDVISLSDDDLPRDDALAGSSDVSLSDVIGNDDTIPLCEDILKEVISLSGDLQSDINVDALGGPPLAEAPLPSFLDFYQSYSTASCPPVSESSSTRHSSALSSSSSAASFLTSSTASTYSYMDAFKTTASTNAFADSFKTTASSYSYSDIFKTTAASTYSYSDSFKTTASTYSYSDSFKTTASTYNFSDTFKTTASSYNYSDTFKTTAASTYSYSDSFKTTASTYSYTDAFKTTASNRAEHYSSGSHGLTQPLEKSDHFPTPAPSDYQAHRATSEITGCMAERPTASSSLNKDCDDPSVRWVRMPHEDPSRQCPVMMPFPAPHPYMPPVFTFQPWYSCYMFPPPPSYP